MLQKINYYQQGSDQFVTPAIVFILYQIDGSSKGTVVDHVTFSQKSRISF